jgi:hypothetical protein
MTDHDINTATPQAARNALSRRYVPRGKTQTLPGLALGLAVLAAVALANKIARMAWAMMVRGERFNEPKLLAVAA